MNAGNMGTILEIDLTREKITKKPIDPALKHQFIGGRGINAKILYDRLTPGVDPLGPENMLIIGTGPLVGTLTPGASRGRIAYLSPLTGFLGDSSLGGAWCPELRYAGYDHVIITGKAEKPVYLWLYNDHCEIRKAERIWGRGIRDTDRIIKNEVDEKNAEVLSIGPAGENLVRYACIACSVYDFAGRLGGGAVMGSKNLKALVVRGTQGTPVIDPGLFEESVVNAYRKLNESWRYRILFNIGAARQVFGASDAGTSEGISLKDMTAEDFHRDYVVKRKACFACPINCLYSYVVREGIYTGCYGQGFPANPAVEFKGKLQINSLPEVLQLYTLANDYGLDVDSTGSSIAFAIECYMRGMLTSDQCDGLDLEYGDYETVLELMKKITYREGFGDILAEGIMRSSKMFETDVEEIASPYCVKGLELKVDMNTQHYLCALAHAVSSRGGCHTRTQCWAAQIELEPSPANEKQLFGRSGLAEPFSVDGKALMVKYYEDLLAVSDSLGVCTFVTDGVPMLDLNDLSQFLYAAMGWRITKDELLKSGERINNIERLFNLREGLTRAQDTLPQFPNRDDLNTMIENYYVLRGWDPKTGHPTPNKLKELDLRLV